MTVKEQKTSTTNKEINSVKKVFTRSSLLMDVVNDNLSVETTATKSKIINKK